VKLIVGLGNPGPRYAQTRHNAGFEVVEKLAIAERAVFEPRFSGEYAEFSSCAQRIGLLKPGTFMNESGRSVLLACAHFALEPEAVLVVHDELDLPWAELRLKSGGGDGGHRGLRSVSAQLRSPGYGRLRFGVGRPGADFAGDVADFVLQAFAFDERRELESVLDRASKVVRAVISDGLPQAMNRTNQRTVR
jgi:PTH1 family peptidyl-tRNA hydrolase